MAIHNHPIPYYYRLFFSLILSLIACDEEGDEIGTENTTEDEQIPRTVLFYMAGDNSLSSYVSTNLDLIKEGMEEDGLNNGNLLVFTDTKSDSPQLFQLVLEADTIRQISIDTYSEDQSSASTETLTEVIDKVITDFPAESYGLVLWSHATAWLPTNGKEYLTRSFAVDNNSTDYMEINDLAAALSAYYFDFILFDACYMASTEVVYALRDCADYIIGSPTEILANGFPYDEIIGMMFEDEADVQGIATAFYKLYEDSYGTISLIKCSALENLATSCRSIFSDKTEEDLFAISVDDLQIMEYLTGSYHALYDFDDYVSRLATTDQYAVFQQCLEEAVPYKANTPYSLYSYNGGKSIAINTYSGLSIYVPQEDLSTLNEWYKDLEWYQDVYQ